MANTLAPYYGEFLVSPIPLELSLVEPCDYSCSYCFAVLNDRYRAAKSGKSVHSSSLKSVLNLLQGYSQRSTLEAVLLQYGAPILLSNRTDPFGRVNRSASLPVLQILRELNIPVAIQTKGFTRSNDFAEVMAVLDYPTCWYISIASLSEEFQQKIEPGAPSIQHRLDLIEQLKERGHEVVVGINPCVPEWNDRPDLLIDELKKRGVWGVWIEALHLSSDQRKQLTERESANLTAPVIQRASKRSVHPEDLAHCYQTRDIALEAGLEVFSIGQTIRSNFFDVYHNCYQSTFPTAQDWLNLCIDELPDGAILEFTDWAEFFLPFLPDGVHRTGHYLGASSRNLAIEMKGKWTNHLSYESLLRLIWSNLSASACPAKHPCFSFVKTQDAEGDIALTDPEGMPLMVFHRQGWSAYWVDPEKPDQYFAEAA